MPVVLEIGIGLVSGLVVGALGGAGAVAAATSTRPCCCSLSPAIITVSAALMIRDARRGPAGEDGPSPEPDDEADTSTRSPRSHPAWAPRSSTPGC